MTWVKAFPAVLASAFLALAAERSAGQMISGRVLEAGSNLPIVAATISAMTGGEAVVSMTSDSTGFFHMTLPRSGRYHVRVDRLGYAPAQSDTLSVGPGEALQLVIRLGVEAVPLAPLVVVERRSIGASIEFYRRVESGRRTGVGWFITRAELDATRAVSLTGVFSRVPLVGMVYDGRGNAQPVMLSQGGCRPTVYLNGAPLSLAGGESIDELLDPNALEGVEIYRNRTELPLSLAGPRECGAIVLWTRPGQSTRGGGFWRVLVGGGALVGLLVLFLTG